MCVEGKRLYWRYSGGGPNDIESMAIDGTDMGRVRGVNKFYRGGLAILGHNLFFSYEVNYTH